MKLTKRKLKQIIKEELRKEWLYRSELNPENLPPQTGPGWGKKYHVEIPQGKLEVDDLDAATPHLKHNAISMVSEQKRSGMEGWDIIDLDLNETFGVFTQLIEKCQPDRTN